MYNMMILHQPRIPEHACPSEQRCVHSLGMLRASSKPFVSQRMDKIHLLWRQRTHLVRSGRDMFQSLEVHVPPVVGIWAFLQKCTGAPLGIWPKPELLLRSPEAAKGDGVSLFCCQGGERVRMALSV